MWLVPWTAGQRDADTRLPERRDGAGIRLAGGWGERGQCSLACASAAGESPLHLVAV